MLAALRRRRRRRHSFIHNFTSAELLAEATAIWKASRNVNGRVLKDLSKNGLHAYFGSTKAAAIMDGALWLAGIVNNSATTPNHAALNITGDIDLRCDLTPSTTNPGYLVSKWVSANGYLLDIAVNQAGDPIRFQWGDGTSTFGATSTATLASVGWDAGERIQIRVTMDVDNGAGSREIKFWYRTDNRLDNSGWTQLGTTITGAVTSISPNTALFYLGVFNGTAATFNGAIHRAIVKNGIDGTTVFDVDFSTQADGTLSFTETTGKTVTVNQSAATTNDPRLLDYVDTKYLYLPGVAGNYASAPDSAVLDITGDIDLRCRVSLDDWAAGSSAFIAKWGASGFRSYLFRQGTAGKLQFVPGTNATGTGGIAVESTVATGLVNGTTKWVRVVWDADNGAGGHTTRFYLSDDGVTWTQLGADVVVGLAAASLFVSTQPAEIGSAVDGTANAGMGKFYRAQVRNGIDGTIVFDADFSKATEPFATFTEDSANAATVTINRTATGRKAAIVDRTMLLLGTDDYLSVLDNNLLDFAAGDSFAVALLMRRFGSSVAQVFLAKRAGTAATDTGYSFRSATGSGVNHAFEIADGTNLAGSGSLTLTAGLLKLWSGVRNVSDDSVRSYEDATVDPTLDTDTTTGTLFNAENLRIGRFSGAGTNYGDFEFVAAAVFRRALTTAELAQLKTELLAL